MPLKPRISLSSSQSPSLSTSSVLCLFSLLFLYPCSFHSCSLPSFASFTFLILAFDSVAFLILALFHLSASSCGLLDVSKECEQITHDYLVPTAAKDLKSNGSWDSADFVCFYVVEYQ